MKYVLANSRKQPESKTTTTFYSRTTPHILRHTRLPPILWITLRFPIQCHHVYGAVRRNIYCRSRDRKNSSKFRKSYIQTLVSLIYYYYFFFLVFEQLFYFSDILSMKKNNDLKKLLSDASPSATSVTTRGTEDCT